ncbi:hypothetical protein Tco_1500737 [Tanacetum coccineum]
MYGFKEYSSCGALYNKSCGCSKEGFVDKFVRDPNCPKCGNPVDGLYCRQCALLRKKLEELWFIICDENEIFQDFLNTFESSNDNTNVVNAPQEPFVFNQDPDNYSSQSPPHIDHHCCYGCGDSLDGIFCQRCTCDSCGNNAHYGYNCPPKVLIISNPKPCYNQNVRESPQTLLSFHPTCYYGDENSFTYDSNLNFVDDSPNPPPQPLTYSYEFCGNDAHYGHYCPPQVPFIYNPEPNYGGPHVTFQCQPLNQNFYNSNSFGFDQFQPPQSPVIHQPPQEISIQDMEDLKQQYLYKMKSLINEFPIKYYRDEKIDIKINELKENFNGMNDDDDDDEEYTIAITPVLPIEKPDNSLSIGDEHLSTIPEMESDEVIKSSVEDLVLILSESKGISNDTCGMPFCDNSPPLDVLNDHFEILSDFNDDCTSSDDDSFEDIDYVEASPPDFKLSPSTFPIPVEDSDSFFKKSDTSLSYSDNSLPEFETFSDHTKKRSSGSTTTHADNSLPEYDSFLFETKPDQGELTSVVIEDILGEPHVYVPNVLPTHTTLMLNSDFIPSDDSLISDLEVSFPSGTRNNILDPGIFFEVQSMRFLSRDTFSISFICDPLSPVFDTLLPFSSKNEDKVFNHGSLSSNEEKSPHLLSHRGFNPSKIIFDFSKSPMMIYGGDIPILDVPFLHFYPP